MRTQLKVIMNEEEWDIYKGIFQVGVCAHRPPIPPSFPVLVITSVVPSAFTTYSLQAEHSFVEVGDLKKMLGLL